MFFFSKFTLVCLFHKLEKKPKIELELFVHKLQSSLHKLCVVGVFVATVCVHMMTKLNCLLRFDETLVCGAFGFSDRHTTSLSHPRRERGRYSSQHIIIICVMQHAMQGNIVCFFFSFYMRETRKICEFYS